MIRATIPRRAHLNYAPFSSSCVHYYASASVPHVIDRLSALGFSTQEARVYIALLQQPFATGYEVAKSAGLARANVYQVLAGLTDRGIIDRVSADAPARFVAHPPAEVLGRIKRETAELADALITDLAALTVPRGAGVVLHAARPRRGDRSRIRVRQRGPRNASPSAPGRATCDWLAGPLHVAAENGCQVVVNVFGDTDLDIGEVYRHEEPSRTVGGHLLTLAVDYSTALVASFDGPAGAVFTSHPALVRVVEKLIRDETYLAAIYERFPEELEAAFGKHLVKLRTKVLPPEQAAQLISIVGFGAESGAHTFWERTEMSAIVIVDALWGDSGKGKACAYLARKHDAALAVRAGVGTNAGASVTLDDGTLVKARQFPTGWINPRTRVAVGSGVLVDPAIAAAEIDRFGLAGRAMIDGRCAVITPEHIAAERADAHLATTVGSSCSGSGHARADFILRRARAGPVGGGARALHRRRGTGGEHARRGRRDGADRRFAGHDAVARAGQRVPVHDVGQLHVRRGDGRRRAELAARHRRRDGGEGDADPGRRGAAAVRDDARRGGRPRHRRVRREHRPPAPQGRADRLRAARIRDDAERADPDRADASAITTSRRCVAPVPPMRSRRAWWR